MKQWPDSISELRFLPKKFLPLSDCKELAVILLGAIGDAVCLTPTLRAIKNQYPDIKLYLICEPPLQEFMPTDIIDSFFLPKGSKFEFSDIAELFNWINNRNIDTVVNLHSTFRSALLSYRMQKEADICAYGLLSDGRLAWIEGNLWHNLFHRTFYPKFLDSYILNYSIIGRTFMMAMCLGLGLSKLPLPSVFLRSNTSTYNWRDSDYVVFVPDANAPARQWPIEYFNKLAEKLADKYGWYVVFLGRKPMQVTNNPKVINLLGKTLLQEAISIVRSAKAVISNDTGIIHISASFSIPTLVVCGPNNVGPESKGKFLSVRKKVDCSPCYNAFCDKLECMKSLYPEEVFDVFVNFWQQNWKSLREKVELSIGYSFEQDLTVFFDYHPLNVPYNNPDIGFSIILRWLLMYSWMSLTKIKAFTLEELKAYMSVWIGKSITKSIVEKLLVVKQYCNSYKDNLLPVKEKIGILIKKNYRATEKLINAVNKVVLNLPKELVFPWNYNCVFDGSNLFYQQKRINRIIMRINLLIGAIDEFVKIITD